MQKTQLALFPLQIFLLPGERTKLHIFEERYRQLLADCEQMQISFGIPFALNGNLTKYGCSVKIVQVLERYENGSADIEVEGENVFKIDKYYLRMGEKLYPGGAVEMILEGQHAPVSNELLKMLDNYMKKAEQDIVPELLSPFLNAFDVGRILALPESEKIKLAQAKDNFEQERILMNNLMLLTKLREQEKSIQGAIFLN